ncbi:MAG: ATP-binding protein [Clostridia bacterium]|nr:ATP-binding protein [Clostridia bacterium]
MKRLNIITGHYGSGKTEFAINYALRLKEVFGSATICDMDIVNPYFRTYDASGFLTQSGIKVIAPEYAGTNLDLPSLPSDIFSVFADRSAAAVLDVGGDEDGAIALGQYYPHIKQEDYDMFMVVNTKRPDTADAESIIRLAREIQAVSRCKITAIVNNANLSYLSGKDDFIGSFKVLDEVSQKLSVPVKYIAGSPEILAQLDTETEKFPMQLFMQLPFDAFA